MGSCRQLVMDLGKCTKAVLGTIMFMCPGIVSQATIGAEPHPMPRIDSLTNLAMNAVKQFRPSLHADQLKLFDVMYVYKAHPMVGGTNEYYWVTYRIEGNGNLVDVVANMQEKVEIVPPGPWVDTWSSAWSKKGLRYDPVSAGAQNTESEMSNSWVILARREIMEQARSVALASRTNLFKESYVPVACFCKWGVKNGQVAADHEWQVSFWDVDTIRRIVRGRRLAIECRTMTVLVGGSMTPGRDAVITGISSNEWDDRNRMVSQSFDGSEGW